MLPKAINPAKSYAVRSENFSELEEDYSVVLTNLGMSYQRVEYYLQVGDIEQIQGWILHISLVVSQIIPFLKKIATQLHYSHVPFKVVPDRSSGWSLINGH